MLPGRVEIFRPIVLSPGAWRSWSGLRFESQPSRAPKTGREGYWGPTGREKRSGGRWEAFWRSFLTRQFAGDGNGLQNGARSLLAAQTALSSMCRRQKGENIRLPHPLLTRLVPPTFPTSQAPEKTV
ncbi:hypothetical protein Bbelb_372110 [Branchiostoma belcheri]|nr:hypothetical protein Bbelb_372110 [Branchiostoma belcheri]